MIITNVLKILLSSSVYLLSMLSYGMEHPFGHFGSAVLALSAPTLPTKWKEKALVLCKHVLWQPKRWCVINTVGHKSRLQHHTGCYEASSPARPLRWDSNQTRKVGNLASYLVLCSPVVILFQQTSLIFPVFWQKPLFSNDLQRNEWSWVCFPSAFAGRTLGLKSYSTPPFFQNLFIPGKVVSYAWIFYIHQ